MKKDISLLVGVGGVLAGRALSRQGNKELEIVVSSLSALVAIFFGIYIYKKIIIGYFFWGVYCWL